MTDNRTEKEQREFKTDVLYGCPQCLFVSWVDNSGSPCPVCEYQGVWDKIRLVESDE